MMNQPDLPIQMLAETAIQAARAAGQLIASTDRAGLTRHVKDAGSSAASQLLTELDLRSEAAIRRVLQPSCERWDIAFVGEESSQDFASNRPERLLKPWYWCVDPLDGTLPFMEGRPGYAVSIALLDRSGAPLIGVVYDPVNATVVHAIKGQGAYQDEAPLLMQNLLPSAFTLFADESLIHHKDYDRLLAIVNNYAANANLGVVKLICGSGAVKNACQVLQTPASCYVKLPSPAEGGGSIWDFAATACIASEAGGWVSNVSGQPLDLNRSDSTFMNHQGVLYASSGQIAQFLLDGLQSCN